MRHITAPGLARWKILVVMIGIGLLAVACGSGGNNSSGAAAPSGQAPSHAATSPASPHTSAVCQDAAALHASVSKLAQVRVNSGTVNSLKADLQGAKSDLPALTASAKGQWQAQTGAMKSALNEAQSAVAALASQPSADTATNAAHAIGGVNTATQNLLAAVNTDCPSVSPSPSM
ncbi:MAG TPA: hypothetical protein VKV80_06480 [Streptosporangiaceae bacterium]|nr:hypothetical protein [Streptosporangiaceae bacterium]